MIGSITTWTRRGLLAALVASACSRADEESRPEPPHALPLDGRAAGSAPPMTDQQVSDLICFLRTLSDDYRPGTPVAAGCG